MIEFSTGRVIMSTNAITLELDPASVAEIKKYISGEIPGLEEIRVLLVTDSEENYAEKAKAEPNPGSR
jgi:hypothetical protein